MVRLGIAALVVAAAVLLLAFAWRSDDLPPPPGASSPVAQVSEPEPAAPVPIPVTDARVVAPRDGTWWQRSLTQPETEPLLASAGDPRTAGLRGRLTVRQRPWLHPAGVEVRLTRSWLDTVLPVETGPGGAPARDEPRATTDADGTFVLRFLPGAGELFFLIDHGGEWMDFQCVRNLPGRGSVLDIGEVYLDDRGGITGVLVDLGNRPIANATLRAIDDPLLGPTGGLDDLRAERTHGLEHFRVPGSLRGGPLPDWVVRRDAFLPFPTATTDAQGRFHLRGLRPGSHDVFCQHANGHASRPQVLTAPLQDTDIGAMRLVSGQSVSLRFIDDAKEPWVGAQIAFLHDKLGFGTAFANTDPHGMIEVVVPDARATSLVFGYPNGGPWIELGESPPDGAVVRVSRAQPLTVRLVDLQGRSLANGSVRFYVTSEMFRPVDRLLPGSMQPNETRPGLHVGSCPCAVVVVASAPGFAPGLMQSQPTAKDLTLTLLPLQTMTVRTRDPHGSAIARAAVRLRVYDNPEMLFAGAEWSALANDRVLVGLTGDDGTLEVPVWPTFFSLQATHPDYAPCAGPKVLPVPGEVRDLVLRRPANLHGRLTIEQRAAPAGFRVRARQKPPPGHELHDSGWLDEQVAVTKDDGSFGFRSLVPGIWELSPELPATPSPNGAREAPREFLPQQFLLDEEQELYCALEAERAPMASPQIVGVVHENGTPLSGAVVRLRAVERAEPAPRERHGRGRPRRQGEPATAPGEPSLWTHRITTDLFGDFRFSNLDPGGDYELRVDVPEQNRLQFVERRVVRAERDAARVPQPIDIVLECGSMHILCLQDGRAFGNRMVRLRQIDDRGEEGARYELLTSARGECFVESLPVGQWTVEPVHGGSCEPASFVVRAGANAATVQVTL